MSLRLSSLDPNEPRAGKDCRTCNRRRIKCDRSLPTCKKCALKDLPCPGYGLRIQWGQGVASRGKLTGKTLPVLEPSPNGTMQNNESPKSSTPTDSVDSYEGNYESSSSEPAIVPTTLRNAFEVTSNGQSPSGSNSSVNLSSDQISTYIEDPTVQKLLYHYDKEVAAVMPWVDGPENCWRTIVIPLAMKSPSLLLAVLALAAEHYASKMGPTWSKQQGVSSSHYRDKSLRLLSQNLRSEMTEDASNPRQDPPSAMLATILILCNLEMIRSDSSLWSVHWKAARTITRRWTTPHHSTPILDTTSRFLIKEAFGYDVFASSTTFDGDGQIPGSVLTEQDEGVFIDWLQSVQEVTRAERYRNDGHGGVDDSPYLSDMAALQERFEYARRRSLQFARTMDLGTPELHADFIVLIDIFHYAGLLYSFQAMRNPRQAAFARQELVRNTVLSINQIEERIAFQHDFVWPLFIVGTESRENSDLQDFVESRLLEAMSSTGFSNCYPALQFLRRFWATHPSIVVDWMQFARQETARGLTFLVI